MGCNFEWARSAALTDFGSAMDPMAVLSASGPDADADDSNTDNNSEPCWHNGEPGEGPAPADGAAAANTGRNS